MSLTIKGEDRRIVPRWRDSSKSIASGELLLSGPPTTQAASVEDHLGEKIDDWRENPTAIFAADLVAAGFVLGREEEVAEAAQFLLAHREGISEPAIKLASRILGMPDIQEVYQEIEIPQSLADADSREVKGFQIAIHNLRGKLHDEPRNALLWTDLSRNYANIGQAPQALQAMNAAVSQAPNNRFTLRSGVRLSVHQGEPDRGHSLLRRSRATINDPWLLAAEIAVAGVAGRTSRHMKRAKSILNSRTYPLSHTAELASAVATAELIAGRHKEARRLFNQALDHPNENVVAQANWASQRLANFTLDTRYLDTPFSFEARAWRHYYEYEWKESLAETYLWLKDEPFSSSPPVLGSFITSCALDEYDESASIARRGLIGNPNDQLLRNNLVFALASADKIDEAEREYKRMQRSRFDTEAEIAWLATGGLLEFRKWNIDSGRKLYQRAMEVGVGESHRECLALAAAFWAREEFIAMNPAALGIFELAAKAAEGQRIPGADLVLKRIRDRYISQG